MAAEALGAEPTVTPAVKIEDTPEFKAAIKGARESLETSIRESNQRHLAQKEQEIEARLTAKLKPSGEEPPSGKGYFETWGEQYGIDPEAGRSLAMGIVEHVKQVILPGHLKPLTEHQKRQEIREQRNELRAANPKLAKLDDKYHAEAIKMVEALPADEIGEKSYAKALQLVIGSHIEELMETPPAAPEGEPEIVPGPEPTGSATAPKKKLALNAEQKKFCEERGISDEGLVEMMRTRAQALEAKGFSKPQVRQRLGALLGAIEF